MKYSLFLLLVGVATASPINLLYNGSFELGEFDASHGNQPGLLSGSTAITGWTVYQTGPTTSPPLSWLQVPYGNLVPSLGMRWLDLTGFEDSQSVFGGVEQIITTVADHAYTVSLDIGVCIGLVTCGLDRSYPGPVRVRATAGPTSKTFIHNPDGTGNLWSTYSFTFVAAADSTSVRFEGAGVSPNDRFYIALDNVSVTPVPEPSAAALTLVAIYVLFLPRLRRPARMSVLSQTELYQLRQSHTRKGTDLRHEIGET